MKSSQMLQDNDQLFTGILGGDRRSVSKAITLVESKKPEHRHQAEELLQRLMPYTGKSVRVGITGVPGAGKSTFIESFGQLLISLGKKVAVLAVDPSSSLNKGSILGDKTRMEELAKSPHAFIRPSPTGGFLGGIANTTFETMLICEAAGFDFIIVETVGVGQSELMVHDITDVFLMLKITGGGDELQGIKRGIMEMVDLIFINKVDDSNLVKAKAERQNLLRALHFLQEKEPGWQVPVLMGSALNATGISEVYDKIDGFITAKKNSGRFNLVRQQQAAQRFEFWVQHLIFEKAKNQELHLEFEKHKNASRHLESNPVTEARKFIGRLFE